jgi:hypothetical protein
VGVGCDVGEEEDEEGAVGWPVGAFWPVPEVEAEGLVPGVPACAPAATLVFAFTDVFALDEGVPELVECEEEGEICQRARPPTSKMLMAAIYTITRFTLKCRLKI